MEASKKLNSIDKDNKMRYQPIEKLLFTMSVPAIFSMLIQALYNIVDSLYVSKISETNDELTALNYAFPLQMITFSIALGIGIGTSSVIARCLGAKRQDDADNAAQTGFILAIIASLVAFACSFFVPQLFMKIYPASESIKNLSISYLRIVVAFCIGSYFETILSKILQGTGNMIIPMISQLVGAVTNIILDPIFIFNFNMGVRGAAIATVIAQCIAGLFVLLVSLLQKQKVSFKFKHFRFIKHIVKGIFSVGISATIMNSINAITTIILNKILSENGVTILGTYFKVQSFIFMPVFGLTQGAMPIMGYNYGARLKKRFFTTFKLSLLISLAIMVLGLLAFQFGSGLITSSFSLGDEVSKMAIKAFKTISLCFIPASISIIISSMFQSIGHGYKSTFMSILRQAVILIPCAYILKLLTNSDDFVWWAYPISETLCFITFSIVAFFTLKKLFTNDKKTI